MSNDTKEFDVTLSGGGIHVVINDEL